MISAFLSAQAIASAAVLLLAAGICVVLRRSSAAHRHFVWLLAFTALLVTPVCAWLLAPFVPQTKSSVPAPLMTVTIRPNPGTSSRESVSALSSQSAIPWAAIAASIWAVGTALILTRTAGGLLVCKRRRLAARRAEFATPALHRLTVNLRLRTPVTVCASDDISMPETFGLRAPVVMLPSAAVAWPEERLRVVLLHELFHVKRHDWAVHLLARVSASLFWFNPLSWYGLARFQDEREGACDDDVLRFGVSHSQYAHELIAIASACRAASSPLPVAMARPAHLEHRVRAILNPHLNRRSLTMRPKILTLVPAVLVITMASLVTAPGQTASAKVSGVVMDASGARVPFVQVMIGKDAAVETVRTGADGSFEFSGIPAGTYALKVMAPGFKLLQVSDVVATASTPAVMNLTLEVGTIAEHMTITAQGQPREQLPIASTALQQPRPPAPRTTSFASVAVEPSPAAAGPQRVRVGGNIRAAKLINSPRPEYPSHLVAQGVEGTVMLDAVIGTEGQVLNVKPKNSQVHADLMRAAVESLEQWRYEPTLLNGRPVEIVTTVTFDFRLKP